MDKSPTTNYNPNQPDTNSSPGSNRLTRSVTHDKIIASSEGYRWQSKSGNWKKFDRNGKLLATGYRNLTITQLQYDGSGNLNKVVDVNGATIFTVTSSGGKITQIQDFTGRSVQYSYSGNNLVGITDALGRTMSYSYDALGHLTSKTDFNGNTFTITYDAGGYVQNEVDSKGNGWFFTFSYDPSLQQYYSQVKTSAGIVEEKTFASDGLLLQESVAGTVRSKVTRNGNNLHITDALGTTIEQDYDEFNNLIREVRPTGTTTYQYEPKYHQLTQVTYPDGSISKMSYDSNGNLLSKTEAYGTSLARTVSYKYNSYNQLTEKTDPRGNKTAFEYDAKGNLLRQYDPADPFVQMSYTYNSLGDCVSYTDSMNATWTYAYDALRRVTTQSNPLGEQTVATYEGDLTTQMEIGRTTSHPGRITKYTYDQRGRCIRIAQQGEAGLIVQKITTYDADGRVIAHTNALGQKTTYRYDNKGRCISAANPWGTTGAAILTSYDNAGRIIRNTDAAGWVTSYTYDGDNRMTSKTEAVGQPEQRTAIYEYDPMDRVTQMTQSDGTHTFKTQYAYDVLGRNTSVTGQRHFTKSFVYDANNNLMSETDARGNVTSYQYDAYNRRTQSNASGLIITYDYDKNGNLLSYTDGNNVTRAFAYDALNRQIAHSIPAQNLGAGWINTPAQVLQRVTFDAWGQQISSTDLAGATSSATYDDYGRRVTATGVTGLTLTYSYNILNQVTRIQYPPEDGASQGTAIQYLYDTNNSRLLKSTIDRAGNTTSYDYDSRFLKTKETASNGAITQYYYDPLGRLFQTTDALGNSTLCAFDLFDQITKIIYPDSTVQTPREATYTYDAWGNLLTQTGTSEYPITYEYNAVGKVVKMTDGNNSQTQWSYDALNRVSKKTYADGSFYEYTYDPAGNFATRRDAMGRVTQYQYNAYNEVTQITYPSDPSVTFQYDAMGRRTQMQDSSGTTNWTWNNLSQNTGYTQGNVGQSISYEYDTHARRDLMAVGPTNGTATWNTQYSYDPANRLSAITDSRVSSSVPFTYAYQPGTNRISGRTNADGSAVLNQYDILGRLTRVTAANAAGTAINTYAYTYDAVDQTTQEASTLGTRNYTYDDKRQMTDVTNVDGTNQPVPGTQVSFEYDAIGNWKTKTTTTGQISFSVNSLNQYTAISETAQPPQYDANGNMTADGKGNTYVYDQEDRLIEVDTPSHPTVAKTIHVYDGLSRRVEKRTYSSGGTLLSTTRYLYDGKLVIAEYDATNALQQSYTRGISLGGGIGGLLAMTNSSGSSYSYFYDGNGNVVDLTDAYGALAAHYQYDPFGTLVASTGTLQQPYQWSTKETDGVTGLVYYLYRYYNPTIGRWTQRDPIEESGGLNLYASCGNNPVNFIDPWGLVSLFVNRYTDAQGNTTTTWSWQNGNQSGGGIEYNGSDGNGGQDSDAYNPNNGNNGGITYNPGNGDGGYPPPNNNPPLHPPPDGGGMALNPPQHPDDPDGVPPFRLPPPKLRCPFGPPLDPPPTDEPPPHVAIGPDFHIGSNNGENDGSGDNSNGDDNGGGLNFGQAGSSFLKSVAITAGAGAVILGGTAIVIALGPPAWIVGGLATAGTFLGGLGTLAALSEAGGLLVGRDVLTGRKLGPQERLDRAAAGLGGLAVGGAVISLGTAAPNGGKITGFTRHGVHRVVGNGGDRAGTTPQAILDALRNPKKIVDGIDSKGQPFRIFTGKNARVVINPQTGKVISVNPLSGAGAH